MSLRLSATENKIAIQQLKVLDLDIAPHLALPVLFSLCEVGQAIMDQRKSGKKAVKKSNVAAQILMKANNVKSVRQHKNSFPFIQEWVERFLETDAPLQEPCLLKQCLPRLLCNPQPRPKSPTPTSPLWTTPSLPLHRRACTPPHLPLASPPPHTSSL